MRIAGLQICSVAFLCLATGACAKAAPEIEWSNPVDLGRGCYARVHPIGGGRFMAAYQSGGNLVARFASRGKLREWSPPRVVASEFDFEKGGEKIKVHLANAEFARLRSGRIICACNLRPANKRHDLHPYAIAVATSDDGGETWSPLKVVYRAEVKLPPDDAEHGCYEPFVLPLKKKCAQIYFADESPYAEAKCAWQNISYVETEDGGETWSEPKIAAYAPERRDGMPSVMDLGKWRYLALESNPGKTCLHPQIVKCPLREGWSKAERFEPLADPPDWGKTYGGAPYIAATKNYVLLCWQENFGNGDFNAHKTMARVAAMPKNEVAQDGSFTTMRGVSTPVSARSGVDRMLWGALCPLGGDAFLFVSEVNGKIMAYPGRIKEGKQ